MNTTLHTLSALVSGVFFALGLSRLAAWFDPNAELHAMTRAGEMAAVPPCAVNCYVPAGLSLKV